MKIRQGFVSNSSSSSFIVAFKEMPTSRVALQELLFGEDLVIRTGGYYADVAHTDEMSKVIWDEMQDQLKRGEDVTKREIFEAFENLAWSETRRLRKESGKPNDLWDLPNYPDLSQDERNKVQDTLWKECEEEADVLQTKMADDFLAANKDATIFLFEYGDNHGMVYGAMGRVMETGDIFKNVPHVTINNH